MGYENFADAAVVMPKTIAGHSYAEGGKRY